MTLFDHEFSDHESMPSLFLFIPAHEVTTALAADISVLKVSAVCAKSNATSLTPMSSDVWSFAVVFPETVGLIAHRDVTNPWKSWATPFARISRGARFAWDSLVARLANPIKATGTLNPWREKKRLK